MRPQGGTAVVWMAGVALSLLHASPVAAQAAEGATVAAPAPESPAEAPQEPGTELRPVDIAWVRGGGASDCPGRASLQAELARRLGREPAASKTVSSIEALVTHADGRWHAEVHVRDDAGRVVGQRDLESTAHDCGAIFSATVLALSLVLDSAAPLPTAPADPMATDAPYAPAPTPNGPADATPSGAGATDAPAAPAPGPRRLPRMSVHGLGTVGVVGDLDAGVGLSGSVPIADRFGVLLGAAYLPSRRVDDASGLSLGLTHLSLLGSFEVAGGSALAAELLLGASMGARHLSVHKPTARSEGDLFWAAASAGAALVHRVSGTDLSLEIGVLGVLPVVRRVYLHQELPITVHEESAAGAILFVGVGMVIS